MCALRWRGVGGGRCDYHDQRRVDVLNGLPVAQLPLECGNLGGLYLGDHMSCTDCGTQTPTGACCLPGGGCNIVTDPECEAVGGIFLGPGSDCANCQPAGDPCDLNFDGVVDVVDFLLLLKAWGPCDGCQADFDGDGMVGAADFLALLAQWT
jgi:hypothetical protein